MRHTDSAKPPCPAPRDENDLASHRRDACPHLLAALLAHAEQRPDAPALHGGRSTWTWYQLAAAVQRVGSELEHLEWTDHRRLAHACANEPLDVILALACVAAGVLEVPIDARLDRRAVGELVSQARATWLTDSRRQRWRAFIDPSQLAGAPQAGSPGHRALSDLSGRAVDVDPSRPSLVLWTSGTTDRPRGVVLSQHNLTTNAYAKWSAVPQSNDDRRLTLLSLAHAYARTSDMGTWLLSGCQLQLSLGRNGLSDATDFRPTLINAVPQVVAEIASMRRAGHAGVAGLRWLGCGGAALSPELFRALADAQVKVVLGYGLTEASPVVCSSSPGQTRPDHVGPPVEGWQTRITGGRLFVRGSGVMLGYLDDPEATAQKIDSEGWLDTADLVQRAPDGQMKILGRADDVLVLPNGFKVHPSGIERRAVSCGNVRHAVLLQSAGRFVLAVDPLPAVSRRSLAADIQTRIAPLLPPGVSCRIHLLDSPLSTSRGELTAKQTPRRHVVAKRLSVSSHAPPPDDASQPSTRSPDGGPNKCF